MKSLQKVMKKVKSDMMSNLCAAIIFVIVSFVTWLSVLFKLASVVLDENQIFATSKMAVMFYIVNMILACILTITCYELVLVMQSYIKN
nr:MAG TPA: hypothetical protein [Caudoviricetes sp.]